VLVLNALALKSSDLLEFNQKHNAAIFSSKCETIALLADAQPSGAFGGSAPQLYCAQKDLF